LPAQYQPFIEVSDALGYSTQWIVQRTSSSSSSLQSSVSFTSPEAQSSNPLVIDALSEYGRKILNDYSSTKAIIRQQVANPLTLFGSPVSIDCFVAITSFHPLRAYIHQQGLVYQRDNQTGLKKVEGHSPWSLVDFMEYISKNFGPKSSSKALKSAYDSITRLLLVSEVIVATQREYSSPVYENDEGFDMSNSIDRGEKIEILNEIHAHKDIRSPTASRITSNGVNLIAVEIMLNSTFDAWIVNVEMGNELYRTSKSDGSVFIKVMRTVVDDYIALISSRVKVANEVNHALEWAMSQRNIGIMGLSCSITHEVCLSYDDLAYLLNWRREMAASNNFVPIYPISASDELQALMNDLSESSVRKKILTKEISLSIVHPTWDLNNFLSQMKQYFDRQMNNNIFRNYFLSDKFDKQLSAQHDIPSIENCDQGRKLGLNANQNTQCSIFFILYAL